MPTYQTKPRTVEAFRWTGQEVSQFPPWAQDPRYVAPSGTALYVYTTSGPVRVERGSWLIQGDREIYPCIHRDFKKRYEPLSFADQPASGQSPEQLGAQYRDYRE